MSSAFYALWIFFCSELKTNQKDWIDLIPNHALYVLPSAEFSPFHSQWLQGAIVIPENL